jgi:hypothetical protein
MATTMVIKPSWYGVNDSEAFPTDVRARTHQ